jgi:hypothetical protein
MKAIVISEEAFKAAFDECARDLELQKHVERDTRSTAEEMHRKFNYHMRMLQDRLEKAR